MSGRSNPAKGKADTPDDVFLFNGCCGSCGGEARIFFPCFPVCRSSFQRYGGIMYRRDDVIVLQREGYSRTSLRLVVWGRRWGLVTLTARGMMRRANNRLGDMVCEWDAGQAVYHIRPGRSFGILTDYALVRALSGRFEEEGRAEKAVGGAGGPGEWFAPLAGTAAAVTALWGGYPTESPDAPPVFASLERLLGSVGRVEPFWAGVAGVLEVLGSAGLRPDFSICALCGAAVEGRTVFSVLHEGLLCRRCWAVQRERRLESDVHDGERAVALDAGVVQYLRHLSQRGISGTRGLGGLKASRAAAVIRLLERWFYVTIGRELRALRLLIPLDEKIAG